MFLSARPAVYKIDRVTRLVSGLLLVCPALARAQAETPPEAAPVPAPATEAAPAPSGATAPGATSPGATAPGATSPDLERRLDELEQRTRITDRKLELAAEAAAQKPPGPRVVTGERGFAIGDFDRQFELKLQGLLQVDGRRLFDTNDQTLKDRTNTFLVRRARLYFDATVLGLVDARLMPDFGNNTVALLDAYADLHPAAWLRLRVGKFKPPVGLERLQTDAYVPLPERALDSNLSAQRDVGAELWGDIANAAVHYEIAVLNGNPDGALNDIDNEASKTFGGRLFLRPFQLGGLQWLGDLGFGIAALTGNEKGSSTVTNGVASNTWLPTFKSVSQNTIYSYLSSTMDPTQTVFALRRHTRINPQFYYFIGPVGLLAEWVHEYQQVGKGATDGAVNNQAGHVTVSFAIGGDNTYDGVRPKAPARWATKDFGALELVARYGWLNVDDAAFEGSGFADPTKSVTEAKEWSFGANWWLNRNVKLLASWGRTTFEGGAGKAGAVTNRPNENVGIGRVQVAF
jgi:phosphate-selective porin OprO/OprP